MDKEIQLDKESQDLLLLSKKFSSPQEFLNDFRVQKFIGRLQNEPLTERKYNVVIEALVKTLDLSAPSSDHLEKLFLPSKLTIASYRKFLRYIGQKEWDDYKIQNEALYVNLSYKITGYLVKHTISETAKNFEEELNIIAEVTNKNRKQIMGILQKYKTAYDCGNQVLLSSASSNIKSLIKSFNAKSKENYINKYIDYHIEEIRPNFKSSISTKKSPTIEPQVFAGTILNDDVLRNKIRILIEKKFDLIVDNEELEMIIVNILQNNDNENYKFFNLEVTPKMLLVSNTIAYNRLRQNYLGRLNKLFNSRQIDIISQYVKEKSIDVKANLRKQFTAEQILFLEEIRPILEKASGEFVVEEQKISIKPLLETLDEYELRETKNECNKFKDYDYIKRIISKSYYQQCQVLYELDFSSDVELNDDLPFTDDNYSLRNYDYLMNFSVIADILSKVDRNAIKEMYNDKSIYEKLRALFAGESFMSCILISGQEIETASNLINNINSVCKGNLRDNFNMNRLPDIAKRANLYQFIDDFTLAILGEEVAEKIVYSFQFLQGKNTPDKIRERLNKAVDIMIKAEEINKSGVPYFDDIYYGDICLSRYNNNDPEILTSGIDSNTCFKISANDNDYLFYAVLNKNGLVIRAFDKNKMCGRITAHTMDNVLMLNGVRTIENEYQASSLEKLERNNDMIEAIKILADELIKLTSDSNCPIDFVVSNKAGILEAPEYNDTFPLTDETLFINPIDSYGEDFDEFAAMFKDKGYLQQVPHYFGGRVAPFTTDFGSYPVVLVAARDGKQLNGLRDIAYNGPEAVYERPMVKDIVGTGILTDEAIRRLEKIDAFNYLNHGGEKEKFHMRDYHDEANYKSYMITGDSYVLVDQDDNIMSVSISGSKNQDSGLKKEYVKK